MIAVPRGHEKAFTALCAENGLPWTAIGVTDETGQALEIRGQFHIDLDELREAHTSTLPRLFGTAATPEPAAPASPDAPAPPTVSVSLDISIPPAAGDDATGEVPSDEPSAG
jgi:phosphoribosylformylglycinamidine synthase